MIEATLFVPTRYNDGRPIRRTTRRELRDRPAVLGGGLTISGISTGFWLSAGRSYEERVRSYTVALDSWWQLPEFLQIVEWAREALEQEAMFVRIAGIAEQWPPRRQT